MCVCACVFDSQLLSASQLYLVLSPLLLVLSSFGGCGGRSLSDI